MDYEDVLQEDVLQKAHQKLRTQSRCLVYKSGCQKNTAGVVSGGRKAERG